MSSVEYLREFVNERLTAAAKEIFRVCKNTNVTVDYEEEIHRQRRLLDIIDLPQQHVCPEEEVLADLQSATTSSSVEYLRGFVNERLSAAAEEIFRVFNKILEEYEEDNDRQRTLLDIAWKPEIKLHRIELPQQYVCKEEEEEVLEDQQLYIQEWDSSLDQEDPEPPQIKEEVCTSQEGEQLLLKQETDSFMLISTYDTLSITEEQPGVNIPVIFPTLSEAHGDHQLLSHNPHETESQNQEGGKYDDSGSSRNANGSHSNYVNNSNLSEIHINTDTGLKSIKCNICGKDFRCSGHLNIHMRRAHTGERPYVCKTCGKGFCDVSTLKRHFRIHTGEKPFTCETCGEDFSRHDHLIFHMRRNHTGEKLFTCITCGKDFICSGHYKSHMRTHTGEKPYVCKACGKDFRSNSHLTEHMRIHTGEKPFTCEFCGKDFKRSSHLKSHMRVHIVEKPFNDHSEDQTLICNPDDTPSAEGKESFVSMPVIISVDSEAHSDTGQKSFRCDTWERF